MSWTIFAGDNHETIDIPERLTWEWLEPRVKMETWENGGGFLEVEKTICPFCGAEENYFDDLDEDRPLPDLDSAYDLLADHLWEDHGIEEIEQ